MAAGKGRARTAEADLAAEAEAVPEDERSAHAWEFDESNAWEPVVPDTWELPTDRQSAEPVGRPSESSAGWSDAARSEEEWVDAARQQGVGPTVADRSARVPYLEAVAAQY